MEFFCLYLLELFVLDVFFSLKLFLVTVIHQTLMKTVESFNRSTHPILFYSQCSMSRMWLAAKFGKTNKPRIQHRNIWPSSFSTFLLLFHSPRLCEKKTSRSCLSSQRGSKDLAQPKAAVLISKQINFGRNIALLSVSRLAPETGPKPEYILRVRRLLSSSEHSTSARYAVDERFSSDLSGENVLSFLGRRSVLLDSRQSLARRLYWLSSWWGKECEIAAW